MALPKERENSVIDQSLPLGSLQKTQRGAGQGMTLEVNFF